MNIILFGMPGAGKGTQSELLVDKLGFSTISTGNLLRKVAKSDTKLGKEIALTLASGDLVSDETMLVLINDELVGSTNALFDGFPRTIAQAEALLTFTHIDLVVVFDIDESLLLDRISGRWVHPASGRVYHIKTKPPKVDGLDDITGEPLVQRIDDTEAVFKKRIDAYKKLTAPIIDFYEISYQEHRSPFVLHIDASLPPEDIFNIIKGHIK